MHAANFTCWQPPSLPPSFPLSLPPSLPLRSDKGKTKGNTWRRISPNVQWSISPAAYLCCLARACSAHESQPAH